MYLFENLLKLEESYPEYLGVKSFRMSKLNLLVGSNNSGKSRFIRNIINIDKRNYRFENSLYLSPNKRKSERFRNIFSDSRFPKNDGLSKVKDIENTEKMKERLKTAISNRELDLNNSFLPQINSYLDELKDFEKNFQNPHMWSVSFNQVRSIFKEYYNSVEGGLIELHENISFQKLYIPTLRGLRTLEVDTDKTRETNKNLYFYRTKNDYFKGIENLDIFTGLELYSKLQEMLLGEYEEREKVRRFEEFLSENFFEDKKVSLIPKIKDTVVHIKIGEEKERPIYGLGDGIQSIIILTFPLFENAGKHMLIGIEEPEIYLHPGMQRKLMEVLLDKTGKYDFENFQYLITTHSNHFLDLTLDYPEDVIVYESRKLEDGKFEISRKNDENMLELMESLGVRNSSVFLANSTIWVEGITDRLYLKKYMEVYQREMLDMKKINKIYEEDKHFSFIEYSGGNITHWDFLDEEGGMKSSQVSNNIFLLGDTDGHRDKLTKKGEKTEKRKRIEKLESLTSISTYLLECKEIENLLTPNVIKSILKEKGEEGIDSLSFDQEEYEDEGIGSYIENNLLKRQEAKTKKYEADSGTIKDKVNFCRIACKYIDSLDDLSGETKVVCEKLYNFIAEANGESRLKPTSQADEALSEDAG